jgi:hypothetical protein
VLVLVPGVTQAELGSPGAPAPALAQAAGPAAPRTMIFEDHSDGAHDRSRMRLHAGGEVVEIEVQAPRALPPPPPPPPLPPHGDRVQIMIHGHFGAPFFPWGWGDGWLGMLDADEFGHIQILIDEDGDPWGFHGDFSDLDDGWLEHVERAQEHADRVQARIERAQERAERARERAERVRGRHADEWSGLFGVAWAGEAPEDVDADEGCRLAHGCDIVEL